jgi:hypothetical protein
VDTLSNNAIIMTSYELLGVSPDFGG